jgi:hypothetical protein
MLIDLPRMDRVLGRLRFAGTHWGQVADALLSHLGNGTTAVIYGLGRNGRDLLASIEQALDQRLSAAMAGAIPRPALPRIAWIDDNAAAEAPLLLGRPLPRLRASALTNRHLVIVTPDGRTSILPSLAARGLRNVHTPESLVASYATYS